MAAPLKILLITLKLVALEKLFFLVIDKFLRLLVKTLRADDKHYLLNRNNLAQPTHMQLFQKTKNFFPTFFWHFKIFIKF